MNNKCPYCHINLVLGLAIDPETKEALGEFSYYNKGKLIKCYKCPNCGHAEYI